MSHRPILQLLADGSIHCGTWIAAKEFLTVADLVRNGFGDVDDDLEFYPTDAGKALARSEGWLITDEDGYRGERGPNYENVDKTEPGRAMSLKEINDAMLKNFVANNSFIQRLKAK